MFDSRVNRPELIVFADDWGRHPSSCQHLVRRLRNEYRILWVNSIGTRKIRLNLFTLRRAWEKLCCWRKGLIPIDDDMAVIDMPMLPWIGSRLARSANRWMATNNLRKQMKRLNFRRPVVLTTLPHVSWLIGDVGQCATLYYCTDDFSHWPSADRKALQWSESLLLQQADLVLAVSQHLVSRCAQANRCEYFPHAVDFDHFAAARTVSPHPDLMKLKGPRIGFFGLIYEKLDFELLTRISRECSDASIVLIGRIDYCPEAFSQLPNVHLVGPQSYDDLPQWIAGLDVLLMPYVMDDMIRQSNPLKLRECLATGKPTVAVEVPEARKFEPHLLVAHSRDEFVKAVKLSLLEHDNSDAVEARQLAVANETWESRARELSDYIHSIDSFVA